MTCPNLGFQHPGEFSPDITISTGVIKVGLLTTISVTLHNAGAAGLGNVCIYWSPIDHHLKLVAPTPIVTSNFNPLPTQLVPAAGSCVFTYAWAPGGLVTSDVSNPFQIAIFAQATTVAQPGDGGEPCPGVSYPNDFNPLASYNAAAVFPFSLVPFNGLPVAADDLPGGADASV